MESNWGINPWERVDPTSGARYTVVCDEYIKGKTADPLEEICGKVRLRGEGSR